MSHYKYNFLTGTFLATIMCSAVAIPAKAEDCTGLLPGADCTLDEDTAAALEIDNGVTLYVSGSVNLTHDIDGSTASGDGTISSSDGGGNDTIIQTGDIGSSVRIDQLVIDEDDTWVTSGAINTNNDGSDIDLGAGDGGEELQFISGGSFLGEIDGNAADIVNFGADGNGGDFTAYTQIESVSVVLTSGSLTVNSSFGSGIGLGALTVSSGTDLTMNSNVIVDGALDVDGDVYIDAGTILSTDTYVVDGDAANFTIGVETDAGSTSSGAISVASGGAVDLSADTISIVVDSASDPLQAGTVNGIVVGNGGATILPTLVDSSYVYDFTLVQDGDNLNLVIAVGDLADITTSKNNEKIATIMFERFAESDSAAINKIQSLLGNDSSCKGFNERLESLLPTLDGGYAASSDAIISQSMRAIDDRTLYNRNFVDTHSLMESGGEVVFASGNKDLKTGEMTKNETKDITKHSANIWGKVFYNSNIQSAGDVDGFRMKTSGMIMGADMADPSGNTLLGGAIVAGNSNIRSYNANSSKTDVESSGFSLYGGRKIMKDTLFNAILSYVYNNNTVVRRNVGGIIGNNANAKFSSEQLSMKSNISKHYMLSNGVHLKPHAFVGYDYVSADPYVENSSNLNLGVSYASMNRIYVGMGADVGRFYKLENNTLLYPSVNMSYEYAPFMDDVESSTVFGGTELVVSGNEVAKHNLNTGVSIKMQKSEKLQFNAEYVLGLNEYQKDHAVSAKMIYDF